MSGEERTARVMSQTERGAFTCTHKLCMRCTPKVNVQANDCVQTARKSAVEKLEKRALFDCDYVSWVCDASHSYSPKSSHSCMQAQHTDLDFLLL